MNNTLPPRKDRRGNEKKGGWLTWIVMLAVFVVAACAGAYYANYHNMFNEPEEKKPAETTEKRMVATDKTIVMLMGVDQREGDVGRSDTLMISMLDPKKKKVSLLSVPRDSRVKIKRYGYDKINAAYAYGGYKLSKSTVEDLLGVTVNHYVQIDVHAFPRIIDAIGGVDIDVEKRMFYEDPWDDDGGLYIDLYPGEQHMDGKTAVTYVRFRDAEGDIGRVARQQKFMKAVLDKITSPAIIPKLPAIVKEVFTCVETDMSVREMLEFANSLIDAQAQGLETDVVPGTPMYIDGVSYWIPDLKKLRGIVAKTLDVTPSSSDMDAWDEDEEEYQKAIPSSATSMSINDYNRRSNDDDDERAEQIRRRREAVESRSYDDDDDDEPETPRYHSIRENSGNGAESTYERHPVTETNSDDYSHRSDGSGGGEPMEAPSLGLSEGKSLPQ